MNCEVILCCETWAQALEGHEGPADGFALNPESHEQPPPGCKDKVVQSHHPLKWEVSLAAGAEDWDPELWAAVWGMQGELITSGIRWWWWWQGWKRSVWMPKRLGLRVSSGFLIAPLSAVFHLAPLEPSRSWLALPPACWAWNSSCPAGAGALPESLVYPSQVCPCDRCHTSTCWVFKLCFLHYFVLSETFHFLCIRSFQLRWKVIGVICWYFVTEKDETQRN